MEQNTNPFTILSTRIPQVNAINMRKDYENDPNALKINIAGKPEPLKGFIFEAKHLKEILDDNASGITPDHVIFYLGEETKDEVLEYHMIAYGINSNKLLDYSNSKRDPSIFDKADPCPPGCPEEA